MIGITGRIPLMLVLSFVFLVFNVGCFSNYSSERKGGQGQDSKSKETENPAEVVKKDITLSMLIDANNSEQNLKILNQTADLASKNSKKYNIKIRMDAVPYADIDKKVDILAAGVDLPDMVASGPKSVWMKRGLLADLTPWYSTAPLKDDYMYPSLLEEGKSGGNLYAIPIKADSIFLIYNKDLLKKAGITSTDFSSITWNEWTAMLEKIKQAKLKAKNGKEVKGFTFRISTFEASPFIFSAGGDLFSQDGTKALIDSEAAADGMSKLKSLVVNGYADKPETDYANWMSVFFNENAAFTITGAWSLSSYKEGGLDMTKLGFSTVPKIQSSTSVFGPGLSFSIFESSPNKEAATEFLAAMYSPGIYKQWLELTSGIPVLKSVFNDPQFANNPVKPVLTEQLNSIKPIHSENAPGFLGEFDKFLEKIIFTDANITAEMKKLNDELQSEINGK